MKNIIDYIKEYKMPHKFSCITLEEFCELNDIDENELTDYHIDYFYENYGKRQGLPASHYDASHTHNDWICEMLQSHNHEIVIKRIKTILGDDLIDVTDKGLSEKKYDARIISFDIKKECDILDSDSESTFELKKNKLSDAIYDVLNFHNYYITLIYKLTDKNTIIIEPKQTQNATEFVKKSHYVYHVTYKENIKDILKKGLRPKAKKMQDAVRYRYYTDRIFLIADSPELKDNLYKVIDDLKIYDDYIILKIDISKLNITFWWDDASTGNTVYTVESIPPKLIEVIDNINNI